MRVFSKPDGTIFYEQADIDHSKMSAKLISDTIEKIRRITGSSYVSATREIRITDIRNPTDTYWTEITGRDFYSVCTAGGGLINVWSVASQVQDLASDLVHEMGHNVDGDGFVLSNSDWWSNAVKMDGNFATKYAEEAYRTRPNNRFVEDLAESFKNLYSMGEDNFKKQFPNRFEIIKNIFK